MEENRIYECSGVVSWCGMHDKSCWLIYYKNIVTTIIIAIGVICIVPLTPVL